MILQSLQVRGFRNLLPQRVDWSPGTNLLVGKNGQGKTNLLEAVYFLAALRSFRRAITRDLLQVGQESAELVGSARVGGSPFELRVVVSREGRRLWLGQRSVTQVREFLGLLHAVAFTPDDLSMIKGGPDIRRRFLDRAVFLMHPGHLREVHSFNRALKARNHLLRHERLDRHQLDGFTLSMSEHGERVSKLRREMVERLSSRTSAIFTRLVGGPGLSISFRPGWPWAEGATGLYAHLAGRLEHDIRRKVTTLGSQFDDIAIEVDRRPAKRFASQGQQRACALALLFAVVEETVACRGEHPLILVDDLSGELDSDRQDRVLEQLAALGCQSLITTTDMHPGSRLATFADLRFVVSGGQVSPG